MKPKIIPYLVLAMAFVISDFALTRDVSARNRSGQSMRSASTMKVPRSRAAPRNTVPVYPGLISPGINRSTIGLEYNRHLRDRASIPLYIPIR
jgi:hypothetical protein